MFNGRRQPSRDGTSRMTRECQVRFCDGLEVQFPAGLLGKDDGAESRRVMFSARTLRPVTAHGDDTYANVCTITGPAMAVAGPARRGVRLCSIQASARLFDSSAPA